jgi:hypothetical protein
MKRTAGGLWVAPNFSFLRMRARHKTITLPNGERAKVTYDDSGTVRHTEHGDHLDALVRPAAIRVDMRPKLIAVSRGGFAKPSPIRTRVAPRSTQ